MSEIKNSNLVDILLWLLRQRKRFRVEGVSMLPFLKPGDEVLVDYRAYKRSLPAINEIVVALSPVKPKMLLIKRVKAIQHDGACFLEGDNKSQSTDSRSFGWVESQFIIGRVTSLFL